MGPFTPSFSFVYLLVVVDYVSKWVKAFVAKTNDHKVIVKFVEEYIFCQYGAPIALISVEGTHFCHRSFEA